MTVAAVGWIVYGVLVLPVTLITLAFMEGVPLRDVWAVLRGKP